jgi:hypothetical protein
MVLVLLESLQWIGFYYNDLGKKLDLGVGDIEFWVAFVIKKFKKFTKNGFERKK